jgi:hypothetical protein
VNYQELVQELEATVAEAAAELEDAGAAASRALQDIARIETMVASLEAVGLDLQTVAEIRALAGPAGERAKAATDRVSAAQARLAQAHTALTGLRTRHQALYEAHAAVGGAAADRQFYDVQEGNVYGDSADPTGQGGAGSQPQPVPGTQEGVKDPLRIAHQLKLLAGERFAGSGSIASPDGTLLLAAVVDTPTGRQVHLGVPLYPEDKPNWRGGHAPALETAVDADGEQYTIDTGAEVTVVLDAGDAARLPEVVEDVIARATAANKEFRHVSRELDRLYEQRARLESQRYGGRGEEKIRLDSQNRDQEERQRSRRREIDRVLEHLNAEDRAAYDALQQQIDAAGRDTWEPGKEEQAAQVCGLTVEEFRQLHELTKVRWQQRNRAQTTRLDQLRHEHAGGLQPLLEQQAAVVCGLSVDEFRELRRLEKIGQHHRTPQQKARLAELWASPRGVTGRTQQQTDNLRSRYLTYQSAHHTAKTDFANTRRDLADLDAQAQPLDQATATELARVTAELDAVDNRWEEMTDYPTASAEIPAQNGSSLVVQALQQEEGGVTYQLGRKPADTHEEWSLESHTDPFSTTASGLRKTGKLVRDLAAQPGDA